MLCKQFSHTSVVKISCRMVWMASSVNRGNGSEQATGEMPISSGRETSLRVSFLGSSTKARCWSGLKVTVVLSEDVGLSSSFMMGLKLNLAKGDGVAETTSAMSENMILNVERDNWE